MAMVPTKFGIAFGVKFLNQGGSLVHVYKDGSVLITHGGVEMGQGLHTKTAQIAADTFGIPLSEVHHSETSTKTVANTSPTAASISSDIYGMAVLKACQAITDRLKPIRESMSPGSTFKQIIHKAYIERIDLSAHGFYIIPDLGFDWNTLTGRLYNYFTYGVSCSEVEIDVLTGDHRTLRTDIIMDLGRSLNPLIDIGQIEGAFVQGLGLFTMEQPLWLSNGMLLNVGPGGYKIPTAADIPLEFNVSLLEKSSNPRALHSSKAVGEPPLFMAASVFFAIHDALLASRREHGDERTRAIPLILQSPATAERIRLSCGDRFIDPKVVDQRDGNQKLWCFEV